MLLQAQMKTASKIHIRQTLFYIFDPALSSGVHDVSVSNPDYNFQSRPGHKTKGKMTWWRFVCCHVAFWIFLWV